MSLEKAIKAGKEHRQPYRHGKGFDPKCRNNKGCPACESNRKYANTKRLMTAKDKEND